MPFFWDCLPMAEKIPPCNFFLNQYKNAVNETDICLNLNNIHASWSNFGLRKRYLLKWDSTVNLHILARQVKQGLYFTKLDTYHTSGIVMRSIGQIYKKQNLQTIFSSSQRCHKRVLFIWKIS